MSDTLSLDTQPNVVARSNRTIVLINTITATIRDISFGINLLDRVRVILRYGFVIDARNLSIVR